MAAVTDLQRELVSTIRGRVIDPAHSEYELARAVFNGTVDRRPALIVRPLDAVDVARAVSFARAQGLPVAVRGGGHNVAGHAVCDGGLAIDLRLMRDVVVDPSAKTADAGGGATWNDFDPACQRFGLATPGGTFGTTGIGGLTLGGGIGHLSGRFGLTLDNLIGAEVVTSAGDIIRASEESNDDLFWALRGGGGNFGVVTRFVYALHEVETLVGGLLVFDSTQAVEILKRVRDVVTDLPDELTVFALLARDKPSGQGLVVVSVCWTGSSPEAGERIEALRGLSGLLVDAVGQISYSQMQGVFGEVPPGIRHYWKGHFVNGLPDELIERVVECAAQRESLGGILIEPLRGYLTRVPDDATAFANRHASFNITGIASWLSKDEDESQIRWARDFADTLSPFSVRGGGYLNYMTSDEPLERVEAAFGPEKFERLRRVKRTFDPENVFRFNQNIPPAD